MRVQTYMHACMHAYIHTCIHIYTFIYARIRTHEYMCVYIYTHTYIYIHTWLIIRGRPPPKSHASGASSGVMNFFSESQTRRFTDSQIFRFHSLHMLPDHSLWKSANLRFCENSQFHRPARSQIMACEKVGICESATLRICQSVNLENH